MFQMSICTTSDQQKDTFNRLSTQRQLITQIRTKMTTSSYLSKKYSAYSKNIIAKPFTTDHVELELLYSSTSAVLTIRKVLGKGYSKLNYFQFIEVVETALDQE